MALTLVATATDETGSGSVNSRVMSLPSNNAGDLMVLAVSWSNSGASGTTPSGWTLLDSFGGGQHAGYVYYKESTGSEANVTIALDSGFLSYAAVVAVFDGADLTSGITNHSESTSGGSGDWDWPALVVGSSSSAVIRVGTGRQGVFPDPSGDTEFTRTVEETNTTSPTRGVAAIYHDFDGGTRGTVPSLTESNSSYSSYGLYTIEIPVSGGGPSPQTVNLPAPVAAEASGYSLSVVHGAVTVNLPAPVAAEANGYSLSVVHGAATVSLPAPVAAEAQGYALSVSYGALTVSLPAPSAAIARGYALSVVAGGQAIALPAPVAAVANGYSLSVVQGALVIALPAPVAAEARGYDLTTLHSALTISLSAPSAAVARGNAWTVLTGSIEATGVATEVHNRATYATVRNRASIGGDRMISIDATSKQYFWRAVQLVDDTDTVVDPTDFTVEIAFTPTDTPTDDDYASASWTGNTINIRGLGTAYTTQILIGPGTDVELTAGVRYFVTVRISQGSEAVVLKAGTVSAT